MAKQGGNPQNLKNFKKGFDERRVGNGRKKKLPALDGLLDEVLGEEKNNVSAAKAVLMSLLSKATKGDVRAAEVLLDRAYGKAKQVTDILSCGESINSPILPPEAVDMILKRLSEIK